MGDKTSDVVDSEEISESFVCCVCLNPYSHFPTICQMLHFLLQKMYPLAYKRRELQTLEEEKKNGCFSPQFDVNASSSLVQQDVYLPDNSACKESCASIKQLEPISQVQESCRIIPEKAPDGNDKVTGTVTDNKRNSPKDQHGGNFKQVALEDVLCIRCKELLFHPSVLNCGHVYCQSCLLDLCDEMIRCQVCHSLHPKGLPKVCLELHQFLEQCFAKEYALRRDAVLLKQINFQHPSLITCSEEASEQAGNVQWWSDPRSNVHYAVGCDYCGMYPIVGNRYKCKDCMEKVGFDLCGDCFNTNSKLPGRFNQQHTPEHDFELVQSNTVRNIMLRLVTAQVEDGSTILRSNYSPENLEDESNPLSLSVGSQENIENSSAVPASSTGGGEENQADSESTA
ncbi:Cdk-activating kinase assembly factor [Parasponia andersonii]|uniref:Cdk-activating kinase assembly factor n=1 Tax=Parasponia andersonii TaxID=3476 RepID=A0A2P5DBY3_PARAD|nr:Cdk-activating kinase assembly factor [Parasponia andersonii]